MRSLFLTLSVAAASVALAQPAEAQLKYGLQGAVLTGLQDLSAIPGATDLNGTFGIGPRVALQPPFFPIGVVGQGVYYFPEGDGSYMTYGLSAQLRLPLPVINPYVIGGWQWRRASAGGSSNTENGATIGAGVQLNLAVSIFLEGTFEIGEDVPTIQDYDNIGFVIQGGVLLGG